MPASSSRQAMPNAASFGAELTNSATGAVAPWYTSGSHMWNGAAPSLKATPATMNTVPVSSSVRSSEPATAALIASSCSVPVAP